MLGGGFRGGVVIHIIQELFGEYQSKLHGWAVTDVYWPEIDPPQQITSPILRDSVAKNVHRWPEAQP